jgi:hypothetical protein
MTCTTHTGTILLSELVSAEQPVLQGHRFVDARLLGPALLIPVRDVHLERVTFGLPPGADAEALFWPWDTAVRRTVVGGIGLIECEFRRCTTAGVALAGPPEVLGKFRELVGLDSVEPAQSSPTIHIGELVMGDKITTGAITVTGDGQVVVGKDIVARLGSVGRPDAAAALERYRSALAATDFDSGAREAQLVVLDEIGAELMKPEPNQSRLRMSLEALRSVASTVAPLSQAIKDIASVIG